MSRNLTVIITSLNEEKTIVGVVEKVLEQPQVFEVIVIDDGSTDKTQEVLKKFKNSSNVKLLVNERNVGKGYSVRRGIKEAKGEYLIVQDADLELNPESFKVLFEKLEKRKADMVNGERDFTSGSINLISRFASKLIPLFVFLLFGRWIEDVVCGYKLMKSEKYRELDLQSDGFEIETEMIVKAIRKGYRITNQKVEFRPRNKAEGKHVRWTDGVKVLKLLFKFRFGLK
jgi:dolichol-phosphate mannosyltransferase